MSAIQVIEDIKKRWMEESNQQLPSITQFLDILTWTVDHFDDFGVVDELVTKLNEAMKNNEVLLDEMQMFIDSKRRSIANSACPYTRSHPLGCSEWEMLEISEIHYEMMLDDFQSKLRVIDSLLSGVVPTPIQRK